MAWRSAWRARSSGYKPVEKGEEALLVHEGAGEADAGEGGDGGGGMRRSASLEAAFANCK